eukprot:1812853-Karenia_brevis.AAC.1
MALQLSTKANLASRYVKHTALGTSLLQVSCQASAVRLQKKQASGHPCGMPVQFPCNKAFVT